MAPNTTIGAAHPISLTGANDEGSNGVLRLKMEKLLNLH